MDLVLKAQGASPIFLVEAGVFVEPGTGSNFGDGAGINQNLRKALGQSKELRTHIINVTIVVNDGTQDLDVAAGLRYLNKQWFQAGQDVAVQMSQVEGIISDYQHGQRGGGDLHPEAVAGGANGFLSGADKIKLDTFGAVTNEPHGFVNMTDSSISFVNATKVFAIQPTGTSYDIYIKGVKYTKSALESTPITDTEGLWFFYFNALGTLVASQTFWDLLTHVPIAYLYWDSVNDKAVVFGEERHGVIMDSMTHEYLHLTVGARFWRGLGLTGNVSGDGSLDSHAQVALTDGDIFDEDLQVSIKNNAAPTPPFQQVLSPVAYIPVYYLDGTGQWRRNVTTTAFPVMKGTNRLYYNSYSAPNWSLVEAASSGNYIAAWLFATNDRNEPVIAVMGQREDTTIAQARNNNTFASLLLPSLAFAEFKLLHRLIFQTGAYGNAVNARLRDIQDLRSVSNLPAGTYAPPSHNALADRNVYPAHPGSALDLTDRIQKLYVAKHGSAGGLPYDGTDPEHPFLTIGAAIAAAGTPASEAAAVTIEVMDDGEYDEDLTHVSFVHIHAPNATLKGKQTFSVASQVNSLRARRIVNDGENDIIATSGTGGRVLVEADEIEMGTTTSTTLACLNHSGTHLVMVRANRIYSTTARALLLTGSGRVDVLANRIYGGNEAYNLAATSLLGMSCTDIEGGVTVAAGGKVEFSIVNLDTAVSEGESTSTADTWQNKLTLTTRSLPKGEYRVSWFYEIWQDSTANRAVNHRVTVAGSTVSQGTTEFPAIDYYLPIGGFYRHVQAAAGTITITVDYYRANTAGTAGIRRARLEVSRVR